MKTIDGGINWLHQSSGTNIGFLSVYFINQNIGWIAGDFGTILKTTNGGVSWSSQTSSTNEALYSIYFIDQNIGWAVGYNTILLTTNGGENWTTPTSSDDYWFRSVSFLNANIGWAVGVFGVILKSTNGGINWSSQSIDSHISLLSTQIISPNKVFVAGYEYPRGKILLTTNGGESWSDQLIRDGTDFQSIHFIDQNIGWVVGGNGVIMKTTDGGTNWINQSRITGYDLFSIYCTDANNGYIVGKYGTILKTTNGGVVPVELISFTASYSTSCVQLKWSTATELNNHGFEIEISLDKINWVTIGFKEGKGTTSEPQQYSYSDDISEIPASKLYYRLKQIDFNGTFEYSDIVEVEIAPRNFSLEQNYPNPFNPSTNIQYAISCTQFVTLKVYDVLGNEVATLVNEEKNAGSYNAQFTMNNVQLSSGIYFYKLQAGDFVETKKMILLK